jgi:hypothetical protein
MTKRKTTFNKPRMIQYRTNRFLVHVARYLKPMEDAVYHTSGAFTKKGRVCAKGMNLKQRAASIKQKISGLKHPVVLSLDCSAWDAHVNSELLKTEHLMYKWAAKSAGWTNHDVGVMMRALSLQCDNRVSGRFRDGRISYRCKGNRMSGDLNTALGNCALMMSFISHTMSVAGVPQGCWDMLDDGDDCLVLLDRAWASHVQRVIEHAFLGYGMELKVEGIADGSVMENVLFCQHRPVEVGGEWRLVRNWVKAMCTSMSGTKWHRDAKHLASYFKTIGVGDGLLNAGVPILQELASLQRRLGGDAKISRGVQRTTWRFDGISTNETVEILPISTETRESFERAFGVAIIEQVEIEEYLRRIVDYEF